MSGVETPEDFIELMQSKGYKVNVIEPSNLERGGCCNSAVN